MPNLSEVGTLKYQCKNTMNLNLSGQSGYDPEKQRLKEENDQLVSIILITTP